LFLLGSVLLCKRFSFYCFGVEIEQTVPTFQWQKNSGVKFSFLTMRSGGGERAQISFWKTVIIYPPLAS
jgi:hypothetical protein